jgi:hypothetical protein
MNREETATLLRARSALTSQPYGPDVIDAWHDALAGYRLPVVRAALTTAARVRRTVTLADIVEHLPVREARPYDRVAHECQLCGGMGWAMTDPAGHGTYTPCECRDRPMPTRVVEPWHPPTDEEKANVRRMLATIRPLLARQRLPRPTPAPGPPDDDDF